MLLYYDIKGLFISLLMIAMGIFGSWSRERPRPALSIGYGYLDVGDSDK